MRATPRLQPLYCLLVALVFALTPGCTDDKEEQAREAASEHLFRAESYLNQGKLRAALIEAQNAEKARPAQAETMALTAQIFADIGALGKAETLLQKLADADKLTDERRQHFARVLVARGKFSKALRITEGADSATLLGLRAQALMGLGRNGEAHNLLQKALAQDPQSLEARIAEGRLALLKRDRDGLQTAIEKLGELDHWRAWLWRARLEQASGQDEQAIESLSNVLTELNQQDVMTAWRFEALRRMSQGLIRLERPDEALKYSRVLAESRAGELASLYDSALSQARQGDLNEASELFRDILAQSPGHGSSAMALGMISLERNAYQDAQQYLSRAVESGNDSATAIKYLVTVLLRNNDLETALTHVEKALKDYPEDTGLLALHGLVLQRQGKLDKAESLFRQVLEKNPGNVGASTSLGQIALEKGELDAAEAYFNDALAVTPDARDAWRGLVQVGDARGDRAKKMALLRETAAEQKDPSLWLLAATINLQYQDTQQARQDAQKALGLRKDMPRARALLGALDYLDARRAFANGDYGAAYRLADSATEYMPDDLPVLLLKASAATASGNDDKALEVARQLQERAPELHHGDELEGDIHTQLDQMQQAEQAYKNAWAKERNPVLAGKYMSALEARGEDGIRLLREWTREAPESSGAWLTLASNLEEDGQLEEAIAAYQKVLELKPEAAAVLNNLAWLYFRTNDDRARATAADAYALAPGNPAIADTYGWILWHHGDRDKARRLVEMAAKERPDDPEIQKHLESVRSGS